MHGGTASREWPATVGLHAMWPHLVNMRPLLGSFSDLKERMHGPNISTTLIVEASYLMRAPSPKSLNTASRAESIAHILKDTVQHSHYQHITLLASNIGASSQ